jgi:hypothetical protein
VSQQSRSSKLPWHRHGQLRSLRRAKKKKKNKIEKRKMKKGKENVGL